MVENPARDQRTPRQSHSSGSYLETGMGRAERFYRDGEEPFDYQKVPAHKIPLEFMENKNSVISYLLKKVFVDYFFVTWNVIGLILAIYFYSVLPIMISVVLCYFFNKRYQRNKNKERDLFINTSNIKEAEAFIESVKEKKSLPVISSSVFLTSGECVFLEENSQLMETRSIRQTRGRGGRVQVWKGLSVGQWASQSESHKEWRTLDAGKLTLTNKRIIFDGPKENRVIQINKIIGVDTLLDAIEVSQSSRNNSSMFVLRNPYIWTVVLRIVKSVDDPLKLENVDLNVNFK